MFAGVCGQPAKFQFENAACDNGTLSTQAFKELRSGGGAHREKHAAEEHYKWGRRVTSKPGKKQGFLGVIRDRAKCLEGGVAPSLRSFLIHKELHKDIF